MIELIPYALILVLTLVIYCLGEQRGKDKAEKKQIIKTQAAKDKYDESVENRMSRFESKQDAFEKHVGGIDYSKLNDLELERLHQGETISDVPTSTDEVTVANKKSPS